MPRRASLAGVVAIVTLLLVPSTGPVAAGGGCHGPDPGAQTEGPATVVRMDICSFAPTIVAVPVGTTVRFLNTAPNDHAVVGRGRTWGSATLAPGAEVAVRFDEAGIHPFACPLHPGMVGAVVVEAVAAAGAPEEPAATASPIGAASTASGLAESDGPGAAAGGAIGLIGGAVLGVGAMGLTRRRRAESPASPTTPTEG